MNESPGDPPRIRVIGVGNLHRGDDAVGRIVARRLSDKLPGEVDVMERGGGAADLMGVFAGVDAVIMIDAAHSGVEPGQIHRFEAHAAPLPAGMQGYSTHGFGVAQAVELARALGTLPPVVVVFGVEADTFDHTGAAQGMSERVEAAVEVVVGRVIEEVASITGARSDA